MTATALRHTILVEVVVKVCLGCAQAHQARQDELAADSTRLRERAARLERELADAQRSLAEDGRRARDAALAADGAAARSQDRRAPSLPVLCGLPAAARPGKAGACEAARPRFADSFKRVISAYS